VRHDVRQQPAAHLDTINLVQVSVRADRRELEDLVEVGRNAGGLGIVEDKAHLRLLSKQKG
jgi:hypothetical protein